MMNRKTFQGLVREAGKLIVAPVGNELWATDSYWLMPYAGSEAEALLSWWNLSGEGIYYAEGGRIYAAVDPQLPDLATLAKRPKSTAKLTPRKVGTKPLLVEASGHIAVLFENGDSEPVAVRREYLSLLADAWMDAEMVQETRADRPAHRKPVYLDGGCVMPVRIDP